MFKTLLKDELKVTEKNFKYCVIISMINLRILYLKNLIRIIFIRQIKVKSFNVYNFIFLIFPLLRVKNA